jgi:hypothetical protein
MSVPRGAAKRSFFLLPFKPARHHPALTFRLVKKIGLFSLALALLWLPSCAIPTGQSMAGMRRTIHGIQAAVAEDFAPQPGEVVLIAETRLTASGLSSEEQATLERNLRAPFGPLLAAELVARKAPLTITRDPAANAAWRVETSIIHYKPASTAEQMLMGVGTGQPAFTLQGQIIDSTGRSLVQFELQRDIQHHSIEFTRGQTLKTRSRTTAKEAAEFLVKVLKKEPL